jgi:hypothetical protein
MMATGVGYSGRAALKREQCDMHAVGLMSQQEEKALLGIK